MNKPTIRSIKVKHPIDDLMSDFGIFAEAEVAYEIGNGNYRVEWLTSDGLWGIESDDPDYIKEVEQEEINNLKDHLAHFGIEWDDSVEVEYSDN